jgi:hypothetical protein
VNRHTPSLAPLLDTLRGAAPFTALTNQLTKSDASLIHVPHAAKAQLGAIEAQTALPTMDPLRFGAGAIVDALAARDGLTPSFPREE